MKLKIRLIVILLAIIIYFTLNFVYVSLFKINDTAPVYILSEDVKKGELVDSSKLIKVEVQNGDKFNFFSGDFNGKVYALDYDSRNDY